MALSHWSLVTGPWPLHTHRTTRTHRAGGRDGGAVALRDGAAQGQTGAHAVKLGQTSPGLAIAKRFLLPPNPLNP